MARVLEWHLSVPPEEIKRRLSEEIDNVGLPTPWQFYTGPFADRFRDTRPGDRPFFGSVTLYGFRFQPRPLHSGAPEPFVPVCVGRIKRVKEGSRIVARCRYNATGTFFFWVALAWTLIVVTVLAPGGLFSSPDAAGDVVPIWAPIPIIVVAVVIAWWARVRRAREEVRLFEALTRALGTPVSHPASPAPPS